MKLNEVAVTEANNNMPTPGQAVIIQRGNKRIKGTVDKVDNEKRMFTINSSLPFNVVKQDPVEGWRLKDDIEHTKVMF